MFFVRTPWNFLGTNLQRLIQNRLQLCSTDSKPTSCDAQEASAKSEPIQKALDTSESIHKRQLQKCRIVLTEPDDYVLISGNPAKIACERPARIYQPRKNAMQSGTRHIGHWELDFETKARWENPLMGWCSSGDPVSNLRLRFSTKEEATDFCKKNRLKFWIQDSHTNKKFKVKSYGINFHHKNRTRLSTK
ncbi:NADH dehydrogenase [ubiquinone] iron-sulfur protein 4, mitochondrial-like [Rhynchophorus ferrugineus]|uniref:NADH dehydrogenase [ubiquinone] iron-sulfur protein 4, mitochondrial-like n=1 Tax=Rhynchophorus ferrugineus TaxID=354439 RepID=UPI003FCD6514